MPTLLIGDQKVKVGDGFLSLSPEEQQSTVNEIELSLAVPEQDNEAAHEVSQKGNFLDSLAEGASLSLSDEAAGLMGASVQKGVDLFRSGAGKPFDKRYKAIRDEMRARQRGFSERNPKTALAANFAGGLLTGGVGAARAVAGQTLKQGAARGAMVGAGFGGVAAGGSTEENPIENPTGFATDVVQGAGVGAVGGAAVPAIAAGARRLARPLLVGRSARNQEVAKRLVSRDVDRDLEKAGINRQQAQKLLDDSNLSIADLGKNTRDLTADAIRNPGRAAGELEEFLIDRNRSQFGRIEPEIRKGLSAPGGSLFEIQETIKQKTRDTARDLYEQAYAQPTRITKNMASILNRPSGKAALKKAQRLAEEEGKEFQGIGGRFARTEDVDFIVQALDDQVTRLFKSAPKQAIKVKANRDSFRADVYKQNDAYKLARDTFSGDKANEEAIDLGKKIFRGDADMHAGMLKNMGKSEKKFFRMGVMQAVEQKLGARSDNADLTKTIAGSKNTRDALRIAFGGKKKYEDFVKLIDDEQKMFETFSKGTRGSDTAKNLFKEQDTQRGRLASILGMVTGGRFGGISEIAAGVSQPSAQRSEAVYSAISPLLRGNNLNALQSAGGFTGALTKTQTPAAAGAVAAPVGILAGQAAAQPQGLDPAQNLLDGLLQ